jgi:2-polyprenyl-6-methoxyphenol hydroxylase-like FAD-dependent oxidoreductase
MGSPTRTPRLNVDPMSSTDPADGPTVHDVIVVGFGPTGSALAVLLAQRGHRVLVLERQPTPYPLPRAVHFDHEVGRLLQRCGIGDELRAHVEPADVYEWRNREGLVLLRIGRRGMAASGWPVSSMFHQPELEAMLDARARSFPNVEVLRGVEVGGLEQDGDGVTVTAADGSAHRARWVVGCDGARSSVRTLIDTPVRDLGFFYDWLIVDVVLHEPRVFDPINVQICDPARPTTMVSAGPVRRRWEFMRLPDETLADLDDEARAWDLLTPWDVAPANATLERHATYTFQARYAERWRTVRVLLAGDAAHQMPPFAGQGMCAGIRDAANLGWKLDLVLSGASTPSLLDTYEQERLPSAQAAIDFSMALGRIICVPDPAEAAARDAAMSASVGTEPTEAPGLPGITDGVIHPTAPHAGHVLPQVTVGGRPADDVCGAGWHLVVSGGAGQDPSGVVSGDLATWFASIGGKVVEADADDPVAGRWFAEHDVTWALQRPDLHLWGTAVDAAGARALVLDLRTRLSEGVTP